MSRLVKFFITCGAVFVVGFAMCIAGAATGGVDGFKAVAEDHDWVSAGSGSRATVELNDQEFDSIESTGVMDVVIVSKDNYDKVIGEYDLTAIVEKDRCNAIAIFGSETKAPELTVYGNTLKIQGAAENEFDGINLDFTSENAYPTVIVFCPDKQMEQIKINSAFSDVWIKGVSFKNADIELNYGDVDAEGIVSQGIDIRNDCGDVELAGDLKGQTKVKIESGDIDIDTKAETKDYSMAIKALSGDVTIGDKEIEEFAEEGYSYKQDGGEDSLDLEAAAGDIKVRQLEQL